MSSKSIELSVLGQLLRLNCPEEQHEALRNAAREIRFRQAKFEIKTFVIGQISAGLLINVGNLR